VTIFNDTIFNDTIFNDTIFNDTIFNNTIYIKINTSEPSCTGGFNLI